VQASSIPGYIRPTVTRRRNQRLHTEQAAFFLYPEEARVFVPHGKDISLQSNYEIHQKLTDEIHIALDPWDITPLSDEPERVRAIGGL
jgi:hypothetical protein